MRTLKRLSFAVAAAGLMFGASAIPASAQSVCVTANIEVQGQQVAQAVCLPPEAPSAPDLPSAPEVPDLPVPAVPDLPLP